LTLQPQPHKGLEWVRQMHSVSVWFECWRIPISVRERIGQWPFGLTRGLGQHCPHGVAIEVAELTSGKDLLKVEYLKEVEHKVRTLLM